MWRLPIPGLLTTMVCMDDNSFDTHRSDSTGDMDSPDVIQGEGPAFRARDTGWVLSTNVASKIAEFASFLGALDSKLAEYAPIEPSHPTEVLHTLVVSVPQTLTGTLGPKMTSRMLTATVALMNSAEGPVPDGMLSMAVGLVADLITPDAAFGRLCRKAHEFAKVSARMVPGVAPGDVTAATAEMLELMRDTAMPASLVISPAALLLAALSTIAAWLSEVGSFELLNMRFSELTANMGI